MLKQIKRILSCKFGPSIDYSKLNPLKFNWEKIKNFAKTGIIVFALVFLILLTVDIIQSDFMGNDDEIAYEISSQITDYLDENYIFPDNDENKNCNVSGIELHGELLTYISNEDVDMDGYPLYDQSSSEDIVAMINNINKDSSVKAILIEVDSFGGSPTGAEEINDAIKYSKKPVIAYIREMGVSAAYWAVSGSDYIVALPSSDVGSIGVTISYTDGMQKNLKEGIRFNELSTGKFKDILNPSKGLTFEEKQLIMRDLNIVNDNFIKTVSENRKIEINKVKELADGSSMPGQMALDNKLIDQVGSIYDVKDYIKELIEYDVEICW